MIPLRVNRNSVLFAVLLAAVTLGASPRGSVRDELIRRQRVSGLTLAALYSGKLDIVMFSPRSLLETGYAFRGIRGALISASGNEILLSDSNKFSTAQLDGGGLQRHVDRPGGYRICWSYDRSKILTSIEDSPDPFHSKLRLVDVPSQTARDIDSSAYVFLTPQCFSPDGKQATYETQDSMGRKKDGSGETVNPTVKIYDFEQSRGQELAKGSEPSWSPDGKQIAFRDHDTYYAIDPSGGAQRVLFHKSGADSGLAWSPDSRLVAYTSHNGALERPIILDVGPVRLRVRRLSDNSEDWVLQLTDAYLPQFQWIENKDLTARAQSKPLSRP